LAIWQYYEAVARNEKAVTELICNGLPLLVAGAGLEPATFGLWA